MAQKTLVNPRWRYNQNGLGAMQTERRIVDDAATYKAGQFMYQDNDGYINACASDAETIGYVALENLDTATGVTTTYKRFGRIRPGDIFEMNAYHGTVASAVLTEADVGEFYALYVGSNVCSADISDTGTATKNCLELIAPSWRDDSTNNTSSDTYALGLFRITDTVINAGA